MSDGSRLLPARRLPVPGTVSPVLAAAIAEPMDAREELLRAVPRDGIGWPAYLLHMNAFDLASLRELTNRLAIPVREDRLAGVTVRWIGDDATIDAPRLLVHAHGGAYVAGEGEIGISEGVLMAQRANLPVLSIDYRMPPKSPFPAAVDDCVAVWRALCLHRPAGSMALFGTSTGGALALITSIAARDCGLPQPAAISASTPWSDLTETGDSYFINAGVDCAVPTYGGLLAEAAMLYAGPDNLAHPLASPVHADLAGLAPTILTTGTRDLFLSCTVRMHRALRNAGAHAELHVFEAISHGQLNSVPDSTESQDAYGEIIAFFARYMV